MHAARDGDVGKLKGLVNVFGQLPSYTADLHV
jgi:hypothetical protein